VQLVESAVGHDPGHTEFGERFGAPDANQPALALEIEAAVVAREPDRKPAAPQAEDPAAIQARRIIQLANYGPPPSTLLRAVPYFFRVVARKRQLQSRLAALTLHRKQLELKAEEAHCALGEALYAQRNDARLAPLAPQFKVVLDARQQLGSQTEAGKRGAQAQKRELDALAQQALRIQEQAAPFEARASELIRRLEAGRTQAGNLEQQLDEIETEQKALKASAQPAALEQIAELELQREAMRGELQSLNVELVPLSEDLAQVKRVIAKLADELSQLSEQQQRVSETAVRNEDRQRIAVGGAQSAYREALRSLASVATRNQLADVAQPALTSATATEAPIAAQRQEEDLLRKAVASFDHAAYERGMRLVAGSILGTLLLFVLLIVV
jgi:chromosome segregation ATPase